MGRKRKNGTLFDAVVERIIKEDSVSTPLLQRQFQISYLKAQLILKQLERQGYIEKVEEFKPVKVLKHIYIQ